MKYVLLIYNNPATYASWSDEERDVLFGEVDGIMTELKESGELVGGEALADASNAKTVRVRSGVPAVTDGPFAEAKEQLAGYYVLDTDSIERAAEIVTHDPAARFWAVEVRPIMDEAGAEM